MNDVRKTRKLVVYVFTTHHTADRSALTNTTLDYVTDRLMTPLRVSNGNPQ